MLTLLPAQLKDAATGLCYLHKRDIVHGDLKGVCPSPPTFCYVLTGFVVQHLDYQRNTCSSLFSRLRAFDPHPWHTRRDNYDHRWWYTRLHGSRAAVPHEVWPIKRSADAACGYLRFWDGDI
jgi:hypothetical protein